jgi:hypothetical protein
LKPESKNCQPHKYKLHQHFPLSIIILSSKNPTKTIGATRAISSSVCWHLKNLFNSYFFCWGRCTMNFGPLPTSLANVVVPRRVSVRRLTTAKPIAPILLSIVNSANKTFASATCPSDINFVNSLVGNPLLYTTLDPCKYYQIISVCSFF